MTSGPTGYAVIDVETTGLRPSWRDRIVEVGVVLLDPHGLVTGEWSTLVNPERDLGQQRTYGVTAADVRHAPAYKEIAGSLAGLLRGRVPVAHNLRFDLGFLEHEFARAGAAIPALAALGVCTMTEAARFLPVAPRTLAGCCAVADIPLDGHHDALIDARAAAELAAQVRGDAGEPERTLSVDRAPDGALVLQEEAGLVEQVSGGCGGVVGQGGDIRQQRPAERPAGRIPRRVGGGMVDQAGSSFAGGVDVGGLPVRVAGSGVQATAWTSRCTVTLSPSRGIML
ncbi:exonuclease domain-containing protein [Nonomuraea sp. NPDC050478]|uniref:3'-5' exonuclease n=1 Tax=Nonomuraea sp. NPDC050478 TaxID=3364365 RepID=UPI0037B4E167